jgi:hypothetical protein
MFIAANAMMIEAENKRMAIRTVDRNFLLGQSIDLFRAAIKSQE